MSEDPTDAPRPKSHQAPEPPPTQDPPVRPPVIDWKHDGLRKPMPEPIDWRHSGQGEVGPSLDDEPHKLEP